jgi:hypothetical protein
VLRFLPKSEMTEDKMATFKVSTSNWRHYYFPYHTLTWTDPTLPTLTFRYLAIS